MQEKNEKVKNGKAILDQIQAMQSDYQSQQVDVEEEQMSFLDRLNNLVQSILGDDTFSVYHTLDKQTMEKWHKARFRRWFTRLVKNNYANSFYFILLCVITGFLVSEAVPFYALEGVVTTKTYVKAILTEVCFIFLSGYIAKTLMGKIWVGFLRAGIFTLMLFVITANTFTVGTKNIGNTQAVKEQVEIIEKQIKEKEELIKYYVSIDWPRNASSTRIEKEKLTQELLDLKKQQAQGANDLVTEVERYKTYGRAAFRVLLLFISALITRRIFTF